MFVVVVRTDTSTWFVSSWTLMTVPAFDTGNPPEFRMVVEVKMNAAVPGPSIQVAGGGPPVMKFDQMPSNPWRAIVEVAAAVWKTAVAAFVPRAPLFSQSTVSVDAAGITHTGAVDVTALMIVAPSEITNTGDAPLE